MIYSKQTKNEYIIMQLAVIDELITQHKNIVKKYPDNKEKSASYLTGFIDCARQAELISKADYEDFKAQINDLRMG